MAKNRYAADYRLIEEFDEKGRVKVSYEYIGEAYRFVEAGRVVDRHRKRWLAMAASGWLLFITALIPYSSAMRQLYIALPFVFSAVPLALSTELAFTVLSQKEPLEHRIADKLENNCPAQLFAILFFSGIAGVLSGLRLFLTEERTAGDFVFAACALLMASGAFYLMKSRNLLRVEKTGSAAE